MTPAANSSPKCRNVDQREGKKAQPLPLNPHHHQSTTHMHGSLSRPSNFSDFISRF